VKHYKQVLSPVEPEFAVVAVSKGVDQEDIPCVDANMPRVDEAVSLNIEPRPHFDQGNLVHITSLYKDGKLSEGLGSLSIGGPATTLQPDNIPQGSST
jgi:hypothetical protein